MLRGLQARSYPDTLEIEEGYIHVAITKCWLDCRYCVFDCLCYSLPAGAGCHCTEKTQCFMALFWLCRIDFLSLPTDRSMDHLVFAGSSRTGVIHNEHNDCIGYTVTVTTRGKVLLDALTEINPFALQVDDHPVKCKELPALVRECSIFVNAPVR